jgi:hypothetical protein
MSLVPVGQVELVGVEDAPDGGLKLYHRLFRDLVRLPESGPRTTPQILLSGGDGGGQPR